MSGKLEKLELRQVIDGKRDDLYIEVAFNPTGIKEEQEVPFRDQKVKGTVQLGKEYVSTPPPRMSFDFTLDGTGANLTEKERAEPVLDSVGKITKITRDYNAGTHEPPWMDLSWGPNVVRGRAIQLNIEYTLFTPSGEPLRAEVSLVVERSLSISEESKVKNGNSADLTHIVVV